MAPSQPKKVKELELDMPVVKGDMAKNKTRTKRPSKKIVEKNYDQIFSYAPQERFVKLLCVTEVPQNASENTSTDGFKRMIIKQSIDEMFEFCKTCCSFTFASKRVTVMTKDMSSALKLTRANNQRYRFSSHDYSQKGWDFVNTKTPRDSKKNSSKKSK